MKAMRFGALAAAFFLAPIAAEAASYGAWQEIVPNNTTAVQIKATPGSVSGVWGLNGTTSTTIYVKLYDSAAGTFTCGAPAGAPKIRVPITNGQAPVNPIYDPVTFTAGIWACLTTGIADSDTTAPAASVSMAVVTFQ